MRVRAISRIGAALAATLALAAPAAAQSFSIAGVRFDDSVYLDDALLNGIADRYTNRPIGLADLQAMVEEVNRAYALAGVVTSLAVLPPQEIADGVLHVRLIEARVEAVDSSALTRTREDFIRDNIRIDEGATVDFERLEHDLRLFEIAHDFRPVVSFGPGVGVGMTRAQVGGDEPPRFEHVISADNYGSPQTGRARGAWFGRWNSVTGRRDTLSVQLQKSQGAWSGGAGYSLPAFGRGGRIVASVTHARSQVISAPFQPVDIRSTSTSASLGYIRPFRVGPDRHWTFSADIQVERNESEISGLPLLNTDLRDAAIGLAYQRRFPRAVLAASFGIRAGDADTDQTSETEGGYWLAFGTASYARRIGDWGLFSTAMSYQYAHGQNLPVARLFNAGGATSVRGYPNAVRSGDSGLIVQNQISSANGFDIGGGYPVALSPFAFVDAALVVPYRVDGGIDSDQDFLVSVGFGARAEIGDRATALLSYGVPLRNTLGFDDRGKGTVYFGLDMSF